MRRVAFIVVSAAATAVLAQQPPKLEPLPEPPPPPRGAFDAGADEPRVRIAPQEGARIEEVRDGGRIVMLKVTPPGAPPYYLIDTTGNGNWMRRDSLDDGVRVPMWTIKSFD